MKRNAISTLVGMFVLLGAMQAWACPGGKGHGHKGHGGGHGMGMHHGMMENLDLTDAQQAEIDKLHEEMKADAKPIREKMKTLKEKMHSLWMADQPNEEAILKVQRQIHALKLQLGELKVQMRIDFLDVLTAEQRAQMKELKSECKGKHGKRGKHGKHGKGHGDCACKHANK